MTNAFVLRDDIQTLYIDLKADFIERDEEIFGVILAILANEIILYLGPPGTAKTYLTQSLWNVLKQPTFLLPPDPVHNTGRGLRPAINQVA